MLCNDCRNKKICKYYSMLNNGPLVVEIKSCEAMNPITKIVQDVQKPLTFKQPIDYSALNLDQTSDPIDDDDNEEKIFVDISESDESKVLSITDILLGGDNDGSKEK